MAEGFKFKGDDPEAFPPAELEEDELEEHEKALRQREVEEAQRQEALQKQAAQQREAEQKQKEDAEKARKRIGGRALSEVDRKQQERLKKLGLDDEGNEVEEE